MSRDLPFFKFFPANWINGNITLEDYETQGLFINICAYYWERDCVLTIEHLRKRFGNHHGIDTLFNAQLLKEENGVVFIEFLLDQRRELHNRHKKLSDGGKKGNRKRWGIKEDVSPPDSPPITRGSLPNRIKDKEEDKDIYSVFEYWNSKNIIAHKTITDELKKVIAQSLQRFTYESLKQAIDNYHQCLTGEYFLSYKWALKDFLSRSGYGNPANFLPEGEHYENFIKKQPQKKAKISC